MSDIAGKASTDTVRYAYATLDDVRLYTLASSLLPFAFLKDCRVDHIILVFDLCTSLLSKDVCM
jgi:hypothetical protein